VEPGAWQSVIVALAVLWAAGNIGLRGWRLWRSPASGCGSGCGGCKAAPPLVSLGAIAPSISPHSVRTGGKGC
jgi:hypothetical protein